MSKCVKCGSELPIINEKEVEFCPVCGKKNIKNIEEEPITNWLPVIMGAMAMLGFVFNFILCVTNSTSAFAFAFALSVSLASTSLGWITLAISANNYYIKKFDSTHDVLGILMGIIAIIGNLILIAIISGQISQALQGLY